MSYGFDAWASFAPESTWGTDPGTGHVYARLIDESLKLDPSAQMYPSTAGPGRRKKYLGHRRVAGDVQIETMWEGAFLTLLKHAMGSSTPSGTGEITHAFAMTTDLPTGLNIEISKADIPTGKVFRYDGGLIDQLKLDFSAEKQLQATATFVCKDRATNVTASGTPSYPIDEPILFYNFGTLSVAGQSGIDIKGGSLTIANNLDRDRFFMSQTISRPKRKTHREVTGSCTIEFEDVALADALRSGTEGSFLLSWISENLITSNPYFFSISGTASFLTDADPVVNTEGALEVDVAFQLIGGNTEMTASILNGQATVP